MKLFSRFRNALKINVILTVIFPFVLISFNIWFMTRRIDEEVGNENIVLSNSLAREVEQFLDEPIRLLGQLD